MSWKDLPNWLKGGIIVTLIGLIIFLLSSVCYQTKCREPAQGCQDYFNYAFCSYSNKIIVTVDFSINPLINSFAPIIAFIGTIAIYFIIGAIIGWILGKFKSKSY
ncbi:MAG: hypothetical protein WCK90_01185 [archaeon]